MSRFNFPPCELPPRSTIICYRRDSGGDNQDLSSQRAYMAAFIEHYHLVILYDFEDEAVSGKGAKGRDEFGKMMDLIRSSGKNLANGVIIWDYARLSRDYHAGQIALAEMRMRGYEVIALADPTPNTLEGYLLEAFKLYSVHKDNTAKSKNIRRGLDSLFDKRDLRTGNYLGLWPRKAPRFFVKVPHDLGKSHGDYRNNGQPRIVSKLEPDPETKPRVQQAFKLRASMPPRSIPEIENELYLMSNLKSYGQMIVAYSRMFRNPIYRGDVFYSGRWYYDYVEAIVPRDVWDAVQDVEPLNSRFYATPDNPASNRLGTSKMALLSGLVVCAFCGSRMRLYPSYKRIDGSWIVYYLCNHKHDVKWSDCPNRYIRQDKLEPVVIEHANRVFLNEQYIKRLIDRVNEILNGGNQDIEAKITEKRQTADDLTTRRDNLIELGELSGSQAVLDRLAIVEQELIAIEQGLVNLVAQSKMQKQRQIKVDDQVVIGMVTQTRAGLNSDDNEVRKIHLQRIIEKVLVEPGKADIYYAFPLPETFGFNYQWRKSMLVNAPEIVFTVTF